MFSFIAEVLRRGSYKVKTDRGYFYLTPDDVKTVLDTLAADLYTRQDGDSIEQSHLILAREGSTARVYVQVGELDLGDYQ